MALLASTFAVALLSIFGDAKAQVDPTAYQLHLVVNAPGDQLRYCRAADSGGFTYITCDSSKPSPWTSFSITRYDTDGNVISGEGLLTGQEFTLGLRPSNSEIPRIEGTTGLVIGASNSRSPFLTSPRPPFPPFASHPFFFELEPGYSDEGIDFESAGSLLLLLKVKSVQWLPSNTISDAYCTVRNIADKYQSIVPGLTQLLTCDPMLKPEQALRFMLKVAGPSSAKAVTIFSKKTQAFCGYSKSTGLVDCIPESGYSECCAGGLESPTPTGWTVSFGQNQGPPIDKADPVWLSAWSPQLRVPLKYLQVDGVTGNMLATDAIVGAIPKASTFTLHPVRSFTSNSPADFEVFPGTDVYIFSETLKLYCHPSTLRTQHIVCDASLDTAVARPEIYTFTYGEADCPISGQVCGAAKHRKLL